MTAVAGVLLSKLTVPVCLPPCPCCAALLTHCSVLLRLSSPTVQAASMSGRCVASAEDVFTVDGLSFGAQGDGFHMTDSNGVVSFEPHLPPPPVYNVKPGEVVEVAPPVHASRFEQDFRSGVSSVEATFRWTSAPQPSPHHQSQGLPQQPSRGSAGGPQLPGLAVSSAHAQQLAAATYHAQPGLYDPPLGFPECQLPRQQQPQPQHWLPYSPLHSAEPPRRPPLGPAGIGRTWPQDVPPAPFQPPLGQWPGLAVPNTHSCVQSEPRMRGPQSDRQLAVSCWSVNFALPASACGRMLRRTPSVCEEYE